ncbi:hypothetical protein PGN35_003620 [Nodosilinea sp. PGN35]|nr:hypothetical protein [Nodosilinea sp. TSF1-S3]MDF0365708.1 hypothetical protein [Nodosilinea sp. TSF1-S3]
MAPGVWEGVPGAIAPGAIDAVGCPTLESLGPQSVGYDVAVASPVETFSR